MKKMKSLILSLLVATLVVSCAKEEDHGSGNKPAAPASAQTESTDVSQQPKVESKKDKKAAQLEQSIKKDKKKLNEIKQKEKKVAVIIKENEDKVDESDVQYISSMEEKKKDIGKTQDYIKNNDPRFVTALDLLKKGKLKALDKHLIENMDVDLKDSTGTTLLMYAVLNGKVKGSELLVERGANPNAKDDQAGLTPLHYAAIHGKAEIAELLIKNKAEVNAMNKHGQTPLDFALLIQKGNSKLLKALKKAGAKTASLKSEK